MGRYFEEFNTGDVIESPSRVVTAEDIETFVRLTGDNNRLHTDDAFAQSQGFPRRIAHGALVLSVATGLAWQTGILEDTTRAFRGITDWKFTLPVHPGDAIRIRGTITELKAYPRMKSGAVSIGLTVLNDAGQTVCTGSLSMLMAMRPAV